MDTINRLLTFAVLALIAIVLALFSSSTSTARAPWVSPSSASPSRRSTWRCSALRQPGRRRHRRRVDLAMRTWRRRNEHLRQRDGSYALQRACVGQATVLVDP